MVLKCLALVSNESVKSIASGSIQYIHHTLGKCLLATFSIIHWCNYFPGGQ